MLFGINLFKTPTSYFMKLLITFSMVLTAGFSAFANSGALDGLSYCRPMHGDDNSALSKSPSSNCIEFSGGVAKDYGPMLYGQPPMVYPYQADPFGKDKIWVISFGNSTYQLSKDGSSIMAIRGITGEVLIRK